MDKGKSADNTDRMLMIDARHTGRVVNSTLNDFSPGQLSNFSAIMAAYRGDAQAIADATDQQQISVAAQAETLAKHVNRLRNDCRQFIAEQSQPELDFSAVIPGLSTVAEVDNQVTLDAARELQDVFDNPVAQLATAIAGYRDDLARSKQALKALDKKDRSSAENKTRKKRLEAQGRLLRGLLALIDQHHSAFEQELADYKQQVTDWHSLRENFPDNAYCDVDGLCKIVNRDELAENDYSLRPGRYVGYSIEIDEDFDYQARMAEIHAELSELNDEANALLRAIGATAETG